MSKSKVLLTDKSNPWLHGFRDPVAKLSAFSQSIDLIPLAYDGENRLVVGDFSSNKVFGYKGINIEWAIDVNDQIIGVSYFQPESSSSTSTVPCLVFAVDGHLYIYQNNQPKFKFSFPKVEMHPKELSIWKSFTSGSKEVLSRMLEEWNKLREDPSIVLSSKTLDVLNLSKPQKQHELIKTTLASGIEQLSQIDTPTCLTRINISFEGDSAPSQIVAGTECKKLCILDCRNFEIQKQYDLPSVPVQILCTGFLMGEHRIIVTTRDNQIIFFSNNQRESTTIDLLSKPVRTLIVGKSIVVGTMNESISSYNFKGQKQFTFKVNSEVVSMETLVHGVSNPIQGYLVGLSNSELRIYNEKQLIHVLKLDGIIMGMKFGVYGREEGVLIMLLKNKGLDIRILQRGFNFQSFMSQGNLSTEEEIPLNIPKKTKLFIEQSQRERDNPVVIYKSLEKDLVKLRFKTAQSYLSTLEDSQADGAINNQSSNIRIQADIMGLGPLFKIQIKVENLGNTAFQNLVLSYMYDQKLYKFTKPIFKIPFLLPHVSFPISAEIQSIDENGASDQIKIIISEKGRSLPIIGAIIQMPLSELRT